MVMDAQPSPQSVGREFVRQYYTLLNKAPNHLHRFYNNHSSFIHGGLDTHNREPTLVVGQKNIHNKIQQLNFRDCHAKISQVDAQATLGNGVVVQVTGELSNDGQPMRRFTQTFVLAAQSPKNYYVHNDIFRYQDLYSDEENDAEIRSENDDEHEISESTKLIVTDVGQQVNPGGGQTQQKIYYAIPPNTVAVVTPFNAPGAVPVTAGQPQQAQVNGVGHDELLQTIQQSAAAQIAPAVPSAAAVALVATPTGVIAAQQQQTPIAIAAVHSVAQTVVPPANVTINQNNITTPSLPLEDVKVTSIVQQETINLNDMDNELDNKKDDIKIEQLEKVDTMKINQTEPKTYANLFKSSPSVSSGFVPLPTPHQINSQTYSKMDSRQDNNNIQSPGLPQRTNSTRQSKGDYSERRTSNANSFGDSHQLFLGNVPHSATEEDLKVLFNKFGTVIDLRLHSKQGAKVPGQRNPPNYGFITYEDPEAVQTCLANCPLYYPDADGQKLNVEEKKTKMRNSNDMQNRSLNNMSNNSGGGLGSQRSGGGGSGPNRSMSNSGGGGLMRGNSGNGPIIRGSSGGPRSSGGGGGGGFNRNDNRSGSGGGGGGQQNRGGSNSGNSAQNSSGGSSYGRR